MGEACRRNRQQRASFSQYLICLNPIFLPEWRPDAFRSDGIREIARSMSLRLCVRRLYELPSTSYR